MKPGKWAFSAHIDLDTNPFATDEDLFQMRYAIHKAIYDVPLASGLPPMPADVVAERTTNGIHIGVHVRAMAERDVWPQMLPFVLYLIYDHPKAAGWSGVSVKGLDVTLTQLE